MTEHLLRRHVYDTIRDFLGKDDKKYAEQAPKRDRAAERVVSLGS